MACSPSPCCCRAISRLVVAANKCAARIDASLLHANLACALTLLANLPDGSTMLDAASALGAATASFPESAVTDGLFADLRRPQQRYPLLVPPLIEDLTALQLRTSALPDLPLLAMRLNFLNSSILNTTGVPTQIITALVAVNASLALLPNLTLLGDRLGRVSHEQTGDSTHICSNIPLDWQPGDVTECDALQAQLRQANAALQQTDADLPLSLLATYASLILDFPPLPEVISALRVEATELAAAPNLTKVQPASHLSLRT